MRKLLVIMMFLFILTGCGSKQLAQVENETEKEGQRTEAEEESTGIDTTEEQEKETQETETESEAEESTYTFADTDVTMYAKQSVSILDLPNTNGTKLGELSYAQEVHVTGKCNETGWYRIEYNSGVGYVSSSYLVSEKPEISQNSNNDVPSEYRFYYDTNRDGIVTEAEIDAYDKRNCLPGDYMSYTTELERKLLLAGYNVIVEYSDEYSEKYRGIMISAETYEEHQWEIDDWLEEYCFVQGDAIVETHVGLYMDNERYRAGCEAVPLCCSVYSEGDGYCNFTIELFEKYYGYSDINQICGDYVEKGYYDGSIGTEGMYSIDFNLEEMLKIAQFMSEL